MRVFTQTPFNVPFACRQDAKRLGARFDWDIKKWCAHDPCVAADMARHWPCVDPPSWRRVDTVLVFDVESDALGTFRPLTQRLVQLAWQCADRKESLLVDDVNAIGKDAPHPYSVADCVRDGVPFCEVYD